MKHPFSQKMVVSSFVFALSTVLVTKPTYIVLLLNDKHDAFWDITKNELKKVMGDDRDFQPTSDKIDNFKHV